ncbi:hypothetical protein BD289DRAFT_419550 [Coniella lustricola]|uniref:Uncharacterized protein n=1 Tax=Coniella lustricola TaxID=2025994 RepID=A0A2T3ANB6_9PEZI|nr:hypothetical protein BD289DRAFT_419550 [Coniella lustricola]
MEKSHGGFWRLACCPQGPRFVFAKPRFTPPLLDVALVANSARMTDDNPGTASNSSSAILLLITSHALRPKLHRLLRDHQYRLVAAGRERCLLSCLATVHCSTSWSGACPTNTNSGRKKHLDWAESLAVGIATERQWNVDSHANDSYNIASNDRQHVCYFASGCVTRSVIVVVVASARGPKIAAGSLIGEPKMWKGWLGLFRP